MKQVKEKSVLETVKSSLRLKKENITKLFVNNGNIYGTQEEYLLRNKSFAYM